MLNKIYVQWVLVFFVLACFADRTADKLECELHISHEIS